MLADVFITFQDIPDGKIGIALVYRGCKKGASGNPCQGCHNPELWSFTPAQGQDRDVQEEHLYSISFGDGLELVDGLAVFGGEPFDQDVDEVLSDINHFKEKKPDIKVVVYTGYDSLKDATEDWVRKNEGKSIFDHPLVKAANYIKIGSYRRDIPRKEGSALASGNQRMFKITHTAGHGIHLKEVSF